ncbi:phenylacetate--CoA ligase family protein [Nocardia vaccinii]|uniref:phenylacetate--CoA ligase family protein n=1 Tax=Nocardia vaccinii TaxID=1822 RepID=UPI000836472C|nr:phenylacetate--CoA ligase family protein [Nocardia vaccinii]
MNVTPTGITGFPPGCDRALDVFHRAAAHVPAYRTFLADNGIDPASIRTPEDFVMLPPVTKAAYLHRFSRRTLLWDNEIEQAEIWSTSSGSSGVPYYWPRAGVSLAHAVDLYDRIFRSGFGSHRRSTLLVVAFAMGVWIGGTYTCRTVSGLRERGHKLSVITPGIDRDTVRACIAELGPEYEQVVLAGYPPFVQDVLDGADSAVLQQDLKILLAGESITEQWREHILDRIGAPGDPGRIRSIYGTADAGVMGHETATTITVRRLAAADRRLATALFGTDEVLPTLVEYDPSMRYTEIDEQGRFLFTVDNTLPLIRYRINDVGRILTAGCVDAALREFGYRTPVETSTPECGFLVLRGRTDVAASFYAVKLYPDSVRIALAEPGVREYVTGKFVLSRRTGREFEQILALAVELRESALPAAGFAEIVRDRVVRALIRTNGEYRRLHAELDVAAEPVVALEPFGGNAFRYDIKHTYVRNER